MGGLLNLAATVSVVDRLSGPFQSMARNVSMFQGKLGDLTQALKGFGQGLMVAGAGAAGFGAFAAGAEAAGKFETAVTRLGLISGASAQEVAKLRASALDLGIKTEFSPTEAVQAMTALSSAGYNTRQTMEMIGPVLDLATAGIRDLDQAARTAAAAMMSYQMGVEKTREVLDKLTAMSNISSFELPDMERAMAVMGAAGKAANQSLSDLLAVAAVIKNLGYSAEDSAQKTQMFMRALKAPSQHAMTMAKKQGINLTQVYRDKDGNIRSSVDIVERMEKATVKMGKAEKDLFLQRVLGVEGITAYNAILGATYETVRDGVAVTLKGVEAVRAMSETLDDSEGTTANYAARMKTTWDGTKKMLVGTLQTFAITLGEGPKNILQGLLQSITDFLNPILAWMQAHQRLVNVITGSLMVLFGLVTVIGLIMVGLAVAKIAVIAFGAAMAAGLWPVTAVVLGLAALVVAFLWVWNASETFRRAIRRLFDVLGYFWDRLMQGFYQVVGIGDAWLQPFKEAWDLIAEALRPAIDALVAAFYSIFPPADGLRDSFARVGSVGEAVGKVLGAVWWAVGWAVKIVGLISANAIGLIIGYVTWVWRVIKAVYNFVVGIPGLIDAAITAVDAAITSVLESLQEIMADIWDLICDIFDPAAWFEAGVALLQALIDGLLSVAGKVGAVVSNIAGGIRKFFGFSDAETGPLSDITLAGQRTMEAAAEGMQAAAPAFDLALADILGDIRPGLSGLTAEGGAAGEGRGRAERPGRSEAGPAPITITGPINITVDADDLQTVQDLGRLLRGLVTGGIAYAPA